MAGTQSNLTLEEIQQIIGQLVLEIHSHDKQARQFIDTLNEKIVSLSKQTGETGGQSG